MFSAGPKLFVARRELDLGTIEGGIHLSTAPFFILMDRACARRITLRIEQAVAYTTVPRPLVKLCLTRLYSPRARTTRNDRAAAIRPCRERLDEIEMSQHSDLEISRTKA